MDIDKKNKLLVLMDNFELYDDLIDKIYELKDTNIIKVKNIDFEQIKHFIISQKNYVVLLGIEQRNGAAIDLLYRIHNFAANTPYIIVITKMKNDKLLKKIMAHNVSKLFYADSEDYSCKDVADWIKKIHNNLSMSTVFPFSQSYSVSVIRRTISLRLELMGLFIHLKGHKYVVDAIEMYMKNPDLYITKDIYWILAKRYNTTYANIDRCMRHAIEVAWRDTKIECLEKYYPDTTRVYQNRPSVFEFIKCIVNDITEKKQ